MGHTGAGHAGDCVLRFGERGESTVELQQRAFPRDETGVAKQRIRVLNERTEAVGQVMVRARPSAAEEQLAGLRSRCMPPKLMMAADEAEECLVR